MNDTINSNDKGTMENKMQIFNNEEFGQVRTIHEGDRVLFCGSDVAKALGYANSRKALIDHCKGVTKRDTLTSGGTQSLSYIPEGDVYRLITHSKLPSAERFETWVFDEVLPIIRKTGGYVVEDREEEFIKLYFPNFSEETKLAMVLDLRNQNVAMHKQIRVLDDENSLLSEKVLKWADRKFINASVRKYAGACSGSFGTAWDEFKKELLYKHGINLKARVTKYLNNTGKRTKPKTLDMLDDTEIPNAVSTIVAMRRNKEVDLSDLIAKLSEENA